MTPSSHCHTAMITRTGSVRSLGSVSPLRSRKQAEAQAPELRSGERWSRGSSPRAPLRSQSPAGLSQHPLMSTVGPPKPSAAAAAPPALAAMPPGFMTERTRRLIASVPTAARCAAAMPSTEVSFRSPVVIRPFGPPPRRATSSSTCRARPLQEPPAPQPAASPRLFALDLARTPAPSRAAPQLVKLPKHLRFGGAEVLEVESFKAAMKELQDPRTRNCIECDDCGEHAPRSSRCPNQRVIHRLSKMEWVCSACLSKRRQEAARQEVARQEAKRTVDEFVEEQIRKHDLEAQRLRSKPRSALQKIRAAAEFIAAGTARQSSAPCSLSDSLGEPPARAAETADVPEGARAPSVPSGNALPGAGASRPAPEGASHLERLLEAAGVSTATVASEPRRHAAADQPLASARREQGKEEAARPRSGSQESSVWTKDLALMERLMRSVGSEATAAHACLPSGPDLSLPGVRLDPWLEAMESALAHASAATSACQSLAEALKGGCPGASVATL